MAEKKYKYFNLETMKMVEETIQVADFKPSENLAAATARLGNDESAIVKAIDATLKRRELSAAKNSVVSKGADKAVVLTFIKPMRFASPFAEITDRAEQTDAILAEVAKQPFLVGVIKAASEAAAKAADADTEDETKDDEDQ